MGFWNKRRERKEKEDSLMNRVIDLLANPDDWVYDQKISYIHKHSDLEIRWGVESNWGGSSTYRNISEPVYANIPKKYHGQIKAALEKVRCENNDNSNFDFICSYINGDYYPKGLSYDKDKDNHEINLWLSEEITNGFFITYNSKIYFKNEEDAVMFKLRFGVEGE